jgi:protease I
MAKAVVFVDQSYEDLELWYPTIRLKEAKVDVVISGPKAGEKYLGKWGYPCTSHIAHSELGMHFDAAIIPGGFAPDRIRCDKYVLDFLEKMHAQKKLIAFICHGGWVAISAKILKGKKVTSTPAIKDDMTNAGAIWEDSAVVVDENLVSSRNPDDLPVFMEQSLRLIKF